MDHTETQSFLGNGYRLDLVGAPGVIVLRREDGTEVTRFSVRDATSKAIEQAAQKTSARMRWSKGCLPCEVEVHFAQVGVAGWLPGMARSQV